VKMKKFAVIDDVFNSLASSGEVQMSETRATSFDIQFLDSRGIMPYLVFGKLPGEAIIIDVKLYDSTSTMGE